MTTETCAVTFVGPRNISYNNVPSGNSPKLERLVWDQMSIHVQNCYMCHKTFRPPDIRHHRDNNLGAKPTAQFQRFIDNNFGGSSRYAGYNEWFVNCSYATLRTIVN